MTTSIKNTDLIIMLNDLAKINNDRIEGYKKAEILTSKNEDLQSIFKDKVYQSSLFINQIKLHIEKLGGTYNEDSSFAGKIFRTWMGIKNKVKSNETLSILDSCEFGEENAIKAYDNTLRSDIEIPAEVRQNILEQQTSIKKSKDLIKKYRDLNLNVFNYNKSFT